jgi:hypothetical protein
MLLPGLDLQLKSGGVMVTPLHADTISNPTTATTSGNALVRRARMAQWNLPINERRSARRR